MTMWSNYCTLPVWVRPRGPNEAGRCCVCLSRGFHVLSEAILRLQKRTPTREIQELILVFVLKKLTVSLIHEEMCIFRVQFETHEIWEVLFIIIIIYSLLSWCAVFSRMFFSKKKKISFYKMYAKSHEGSLTSKQTNTHYASGCLNQYSEIKHQLLMKGAEMSCENNESAPRQASSDEPHECQQNRGKRPCFPFSLYPWKAETWHTLQK